MSATATATTPFPHLNSLVRCTLTDGRVVVGFLHCIDRSRNLLLRDAEAWAAPEVLRAETAEATARRYIGPVMVPGSALVRCEVAAPAASA
jgi:small nuclear ribonucleoprotein (snRNP)-like protein